MTKALVDELEEFENELNAVEEDEDTKDLQDADKAEPTEVEEEPAGDEKGQEAETDTESEAIETDSDVAEDPNQDKPAPGKKLTTLPDDKDAFGELAGKELTAEQLLENQELLTKLITWGHQGRHLVQKGQEDISEAKRLRELLEKRFEQEDQKEQKAAEASKPTVSEEQYAKELVDKYMPDFQRVAKDGGIEAEFIQDFPKAAAHIESRFQSGAEILQGLIVEVSKIREQVLPRIERDVLSEANQMLDSKISGLSENGGLFEKLGDGDVASGFKEWITSEESDLQIVEKDIGSVTQADLQSAWLLYVHSHPNILKANEEAESDDAMLAGGSGGQSPSKPRRAKPKDDLSTFEQEYRDSQDREYDD